MRARVYTQKYVYQPTAESSSQPTVMWHIISHTNKLLQLIRTSEITKYPAVKGSSSVIVYYYFSLFILRALSDLGLNFTARKFF